MYFLDRKKFNIFRKMTARFRIMPEFLIIGAQKSGTTSLFMDLVQHPCIGEPFMKEVHYFDWADNLKYGLGWYKAHFPLKIQKYCAKLLRGRPFITGEASPDYLFYPHVPKRVFQLMPNIKIIVILRNPVDRAFSHYQHEVRDGAESLTFEEALRINDKNLESEINKMNKDEYYNSATFQSHTYLSRGIYWNQLQQWYRYFSKEQFLVLSCDDYFNKPEQEFKKITRFLGLPDHQLKRFKKAHQGNYKDGIPEKMRKTLNEFYKAHNEKLYDSLGTRYAW